MTNTVLIKRSATANSVPLAGNLSEIKDGDLENKIFDLSKKYFQTPNMDVRNQIGMLLETYKEELSKRRRESLEKMMSNRDKKLDNLINVS
jgi:hypothetical protein